MNDKLLHFGCGLGIALIVGTGLFYFIGCTANFSKGAGLLTAFLAGILKECWDCIRAKEWSVKTFDIFDFLSTAVGGFAGIFILIVGFKL